MQKRSERLLLVGSFLALDWVCIIVSFLISYWLRFKIEIIPVFFGIPDLTEYLKLLPPIFIIWPYIFRIFGMYEIRRRVSEFKEFSKVVKSVSLGIILLMAITFLYREFSYSRIMIVYAWIISILIITIARFLARRVQTILHKKGYGVLNILIIGAGKIGKMVKEKIEENPGLGMKVVGFLDDAHQKETFVDGMKILRDTASIKQILKDYFIDEVIVALPFRAREKILDLAFECEEEYVKVKVVPDLFEFIAEKVDVETLEGIPLMGLKEIPLSAWNVLIKRIFDIFLSIIAIIIFLPLMILISILIKLTSNGSVVYVQDRVSRDGKIFKMYKFRTMYSGAEDKIGPVWARQNDPRRTKIGTLLRRLSFDELPQFFNVLKGDMSLVGPRSERPHFVKEFEKEISKYFVRHKVNSGITGWAQVNGLRGDTSIEERTKYDLYYVENWSLLFDLRIIFMTIYQILVGKNAY